MTNEELNKWCHNLLGFYVMKTEWCSLGNVSRKQSVFKVLDLNGLKPTPSLPDYCGSLDLAAEVEAKINSTSLGNGMRYWDKLCYEVLGYYACTDGEEEKVARATAKQRIQAAYETRVVKYPRL